MFKFIAAILIGLLARELSQWCPVFAVRLVKRAAKLLPAEQRLEFEKKWLDDVENTPGFICKFVVAVRRFITARRIRRKSISATKTIRLSLAERIVKRAAKNLPVAKRERYEEEWLAVILHTKGRFAKIACACGLFVTSIRLAGLLKKSNG